MARQLRDVDFVDLYLSENFAEFKELKGSPNTMDPVPPEFKEDLAELRRGVRFFYSSFKSGEFAMVHTEVMYRVTVTLDMSNIEVFVLRRVTTELRPLDSLEIAQPFMRDLLLSDLEGLVLIAGGTDAGKTSTAVSLVQRRMELFGGVTVTVEDPPEIPINGRLGKGRCIQQWASQDRGGYQKYLVRALRMNPDIIFMGEVREGDVAAEAVRASTNGHLIITTLHAADPASAVERLASLASPNNPEAAFRTLSMGLKFVLWQHLDKLPGGVRRYRYEALSLVGEDNSGVRSKVAGGKFIQLGQDVDMQKRHAAYAARTKRD